MSQGLPAAGGVLQRSVTAPGNQPQPQVVSRGLGSTAQDRGPAGAKGGAGAPGWWPLRAGWGRCGSQRRGQRGRGAGRAPVPGRPQRTHRARAVPEGDPVPAPGEEERREGADAGGDRHRSRAPARGVHAAAGVAILAPPPVATLQPARVALPRLSEWHEEGKFSPMRQALPTSTQLPLPPEWGTRYRTA